MISYSYTWYRLLSSIYYYISSIFYLYFPTCSNNSLT